MILLNGHSLAVKDRFRPESMALNLSERQSTATITVGPGAPVIAIDEWIQDDCEPGSGVIWRVKTIDTQYETETRTIQLEHVINTLRDRIMFGETKTQNIPGGNSSGVSAANAARYVLTFQDDWVLGDFAYDVTNPYSFNGDDLFSAMETISSSLKDCIWEYDLTRYPFVLHIRQQSTAVGSEMRMSRNIRTLKKTIDRSRMYTRHYPIGKNNRHITGNYVTKNESLYGVICKVETDQSLDTEAKLKAWAQERLDRHCEPLVTITVTGFDLSEATGESLDKLVIGRKCQVPLPEFSTTITERITKLSWSDKIRDPESVTVTLANELMDVATILKQQSSSGGRGGRASAKNAEEDHAWFVDTTDHVGMIAEAVAGEGADKDWSRVSSIMVDGEGIHQRVTKTENELVVAEAKIDVNEERILLEATRAKSAEGTLAGRITVQANKISLVVEEKDGKNVVKAASIVAGINDQTGSYVKIKADTINLSGYVTASQLSATQASIDNLMSGNSTAVRLVCGTFKITSGTGFEYGVNLVTKKTYTIDGTEYKLLAWS